MRLRCSPRAATGRVADLGWIYTLFFVLLGCSAAIWGGWLERAGPRKAGVRLRAAAGAAALLVAALGVYTHQLWLMWLGAGVIGGVGLGLGYISPVSTLIKWFPDRRGMATGMAIMGFGGGAMIGAPLANLLMNHVHGTDVSVRCLADLRRHGRHLFRLHDGRAPSAIASRRPAGVRRAGLHRPRTEHDDHHQARASASDAHKTTQFWLIWAVV